MPPEDELTDDRELVVPVSDLAEPDAQPPVDAPEAPEPAGDVADTDEWVSVRDAAKNKGIDLSNYADDAAAFDYLLTEAARAREYEQYLTRLQAEQQQVKPPAETPKDVPLEQQLWAAPEYDPSWFRQIRADENGNVVPINGASPEVIVKLQKWASYQQQEQDKFWRNPFDYLRPYVDKMAERKAEEILKKYDSRFTEQQRARDILNENSSWMITRENGKTSLTEEGRIFNDAIRDFSDVDSDRQFRIGMNAVELHRARKSGEAARAADAHEQRKKAAIAPRNEREPTAGGTVGTRQEQNPGLSLHEQLMRNLKEAGITDNDLAGTY